MKAMQLMGRQVERIFIYFWMDRKTKYNTKQ